MRASVAPLLLSVLLLAGCSDAPAGADDPDSEPGADGAAAHAMHDLTWAAASTNATSQVSDSFEPNENGGFQMVTGTDVDGIRTYPLDVPTGVPVFVRVTLDQSATQGDLDLALDAPFEAVFTSECDCPVGGDKTLEAAMVLPPGETASVVVMNLNPEPGTAAYTLTMEVTGFRDAVPSGIPVAVTLPGPGGHVQVTGVGGDHASVLVFGPDDAVVAVLPPAAETVFDLPEAGRGGEYVFVQSGHGTTASFQVGLPEGGVPRARLLSQVLSSSDPVALSPSEDTTATLTAERTPLQAGACVGGQYVINDYTLSVSGPDGTTLASSTLGTVVTMLPFGDCAFTPMGDERLLPGDYTATYHRTADNGGTLQAWLAYYGR